MISPTTFEGMKRMLGLDLHAWEAVMVWSLAIVAFGAVAVGISTFLVVKLQREQAKTTADAFSKYKVDAGLEIEQAKEGAASANVMAAQAKERTATLERSNLELQTTLERERAARLKIEEKMAPRTLSPKQSAEISARLQSFGKVPFVLSVADTAEAVDLIGQISKALENAGWDWKPFAKSDNGFVIGKFFMGKPNMTMNTVTFRGILIGVASADMATLNKPAAALRDALLSVGLNPITRVISAADAEREKTLLGVIHITIGTKQ